MGCASNGTDQEFGCLSRPNPPLLPGARGFPITLFQGCLAYNRLGVEVGAGGYIGSEMMIAVFTAHQYRTVVRLLYLFYTGRQKLHV